LALEIFQKIQNKLKYLNITIMHCRKFHNKLAARETANDKTERKPISNKLLGYSRLGMI